MICRNLGVGVGLRPFYFSKFLNDPPRSVSWVEVVSENYMQWESGGNQRPLDFLTEIRKDFPVVLHGVGMNLGSTDALDKKYLKKLKDLISLIQPEWVSDHLCWTGVGGESLHDLLPLPFTKKVANHLAERISRVQDNLGQRILVENLSSCIQFRSSDLTEWDFVSEVLERADCGLLLDINNVFVSSQNHKFNPQEYLKGIPHQRVGQIHLAGHSRVEGHIIDTHDQPICEEVWELFGWYTKNFNKVSTMVERDDNFPAWQELEGELQRVDGILKVSKTVKEEKNVAPAITAQF